MAPAPLDPPEEHATSPASVRARAALPILVLLSAFSLLDRQILNLMVDPIRRDLGLTDFQMGLVQGLAFALFYALAALPLGWAVDRWSRRWVVWSGVTVWSVAAACCGLAQNFGQLLLARLGVGAGEAALNPAAYSLLADLYPPQKLTSAMSILMIGSTLGGGLSIAVGGAVIGLAEAGGVFRLPLLGELRPWQFVFVVTGLPGLLAALLVFVIPEPPRRDVAPDAHAPTWSQTFTFLWGRRSFFVPHFAGFGLLAVVGYGFVSWLPTHLVRTFGWTPTEIATPLALINAVGATAVVLGAGALVDRLFTRGVTDIHLTLYAIVGIAMAVCGVAASLAPTAVMCLLLGAPVVSVLTFASISAAALQLVTPPRMRGRVSAIYLLIMTGLGLGLGPPIVGALVDYAYPGPGGLGPALATLFAIGAPLGVVFLVAGRGPMRRAVAEP